MIDANTQIMDEAGKQVRTRRIIRSIVMFYVIVGFPLLIIYGILSWLTELKGKALLTSIIPAGIILFILFGLYLLRPLKFGRFWNSRRQDL